MVNALCLVGALLLGSALAAEKGGAVDKEGRILSLFSVVTFQNLDCRTSSDTSAFGTCLSATECASQSGTKDGNCASGFGACCSFISSTCASSNSITKNGTYLQNPSYPTAYSTVSQTCANTITLVSTDICQIRYDFRRLVLFGHATGQCDTNDRFLAVSPTGETMPTICGTNTGYHMYVEVGQSSTSPTFSVITGTDTTTSRLWKIRVTQIECTNPNKPPADCNMWFTGLAGSIPSYNFAGGQMLQGMNYRSCIRRAQGFCGVEYRANGITSPNGFLLGSITAAGETGACLESYVDILGAQPGVSGRICEGIFSGLDAATTEGTIVQTGVPFGILTKSQDGAQNAASVGHLIDYMQKPC